MKIYISINLFTFNKNVSVHKIFTCHKVKLDYANKRILQMNIDIFYKPKDTFTANSYLCTFNSNAINICTNNLVNSIKIQENIL